MKRYLAVIMALLLVFSLAACTKGNGEENTPEKPTYTYPEYPPEAASYSVVDRNHKIFDLEKQLPIFDSYYGQVILEGDSDEIKAINAMIEADYEKYKEENYIGKFEETFSSHPLYGDTEHPFLATYATTVTHNRYNIFSIRIIVNKYFGNTVSLDAYGMTFNTETGKAVSLTELTDMDPKALRQSFVETTWNQIRYNALYDNAKEILEGISLEEYIFYVEEGEIVLSFPCYTFAPGENGAATVHTNIMIREDI